MKIELATGASAVSAKGFSPLALVRALPLLALLVMALVVIRDGGRTKTDLAADPTAASANRFRSVAIGLVLPLLALLAMALVVMRDEVHIFRPDWILHPDETGTLFVSKHLAKTGSFLVRDDWYLQGPAHVPEGVSEAKGRLVPQKALFGYLPYAGAYLVSDDAWTYVSPFFGLVSAIAAGWLVLKKTGSRVAGLAAAVALGTSSPFIMYASGLAFTDVIALAFYLLGVIIFHRYLANGSRVAVAGVGVALGVAMLTRYDFFIAGLLALALCLWLRRRQGSLPTKLRHVSWGLVPFALALVGVAAANWWLYGNPLTTGYEAGSWKASPGGVGRSVFDFSALEFGKLAWSYLFQIGLSCTLLLGLGLAAKTWLRRWDAVDALLLGFAAFAAIYFLGKEGAYGSDATWLVGSYPRYLLPVYAAGVVIGVEGIFLGLRQLGWQKGQLSFALLAVALAAAAIGTHEAFSNERGADYVERLTDKHRVIAEVVEDTPEPAVLVSDLHTKAVIDADTITPFEGELTPTDVVADVRAQLEDGKNVIVVGDQRSHPLYTGYLKGLHESGIRLIPMSCSVEIYQAFLPGQGPNDTLQCP